MFGDTYSLMDLTESSLTLFLCHNQRIKPALVGLAGTKRTLYALQNHSEKLETDQRHPCGKRDVGGCAKQQHEQPRDD